MRANTSSLPLSAVTDGNDRRIVADEKLCRAMVNSITNYAVILTDPNGIIISLNKGAEFILGYKEREVIGRSITLFYPETNDKDAPYNNLQEALVNNNYQIRGWRLKKNGAKFLANIHYTALYDDEHELLGYTKIIYEINDEVLVGYGKMTHNPAESNVSFRKLIENSNSGVSLLDKNFKILYRSLSAEKIDGWSKEERIKHLANELVHPDDLEIIKQVCKQILENPGIPQACTFRSKHARGHYVWLDAVFTNFLGEPNVNAIVGNIRDITEKKQAELLLRENQERAIERERFIKTITDNLPALIAYWDNSLNCLFANKTYCDWFEKNPEQIFGMNKADLMDINEYNDTKSHIADVLSGNPQSFERNFSNRNGKHIFTHTQYIPDVDNGAVKGFYSLIYDITEIKNADRELQNKSAQIENLLDNISDGFIALDQNLCYQYVNKQIGKFLGISPSALIGKHIWTVFPEEVGSNTYNAIMQAFTEKVFVSNENYSPAIKLWQENRVYPTAQGVSIFIRDITKRKQEETQKALYAELATIFNEPLALNGILTKVADRLADYESLIMVEAWLVSADKKSIILTAKAEHNGDMPLFYNQTQSTKAFVKGQGVPGTVWDTGVTASISDIAANKIFLRKQAALDSGVNHITGIPIKFKGEILGVLVLGFENKTGEIIAHGAIFDNFCEHLGAEIKRKQLEEELTQIFAYAPDVICIAGADGYFKKINPATERLLGYTEFELTNRPISDFVYKDDIKLTLQSFRDINDASGSIYYENRFVTNKGCVKWLAWTVNVASEEGLMFCVAKDITDKKELEKLLTKVNGLARIGGWELDMVKGTVFWSDITREIHGVGRDFVPNLDAGLSFYREGESRDTISTLVKEAMAFGKPWDVELQIVTAKGHAKWIRVIGEVEFKDNQCVRIYGSFQDIDSRKRAEIAAIEVLGERNTILESIGDAFFAVDKKWTVTYWNKVAEKELGLSKETMLGNKLWNVFDKKAHSRSFNLYQQAIRKNKAINFEDYYEPHKQWYEVSAFPSDTGLSVYFKDITSRKESEKKLKELNTSLQLQARELAISNAELEQFAFVASHDLQEPLRMVTGFLGQIERKYNDKLDDKGRQYINFAVDGAKRMRQIILDLLEFSKVGTIDDAPEMIDTKKLVEDVMALYRKQIEEQSAKIELIDLPSLSFYKTPLRQVFQNLIGNSLKYTDGSKPLKITVAATETDNHFEFSVKDNGIGIETEYFDKIFIIFQRLHNKEQYSGTGMGLAIVKKIVENFGGRIWVESTIDVGTTFYFTVVKPSK